MDWLTRLPVLGPLVARLMRTHAWRAYQTLSRVHWSRLAAAITFVSFLSFFPLVTVAAAIGAAVLGEHGVLRLQHRIADQVPGIAGRLDLGGLVEHATTVGVVAGALLLFTGVSWVGSLRECLRAVWELDEDPGNLVVLKLKDAAVLLGLGGVAVASFAVSTFGLTAIGWATGRLGIPEDGVGGWLLRLAAYLAATATDFLLLCYALTWLPRVRPDRHSVAVAALIGAVGFELLKLLLNDYFRAVAAKSTYGAFGVPVALLLWINYTARLTLFCAAWTATDSDADRVRRQQGGHPPTADDDAPRAGRPPGAAPAADAPGANAPPPAAGVPPSAADGGQP